MSSGSSASGFHSSIDRPECAAASAAWCSMAPKATTVNSLPSSQRRGRQTAARSPSKSMAPLRLQ